MHRPQPLHPLRSLRPDLAGCGRQERLPLRRPRPRSASRSTRRRRLARHDLAARPGRGRLPRRRDPEEARRLRRARWASASTITSRSAPTSKPARQASRRSETDGETKIAQRSLADASAATCRCSTSTSASSISSSSSTSTSHPSTTSRSSPAALRGGPHRGRLRNEENVAVLADFRKHCDVLISVGDCAVMGGIPAMRNRIPLEECLREAYLDGPSVTTRAARSPTPGAPAAARQGLSLPRGRQDRLPPARLPAPCGHALGSALGAAHRQARSSFPTS
jgi:hypothetical protein